MTELQALKIAKEIIARTRRAIILQPADADKVAKALRTLGYDPQISEASDPNFRKRNSGVRVSIPQNMMRNETSEEKRVSILALSRAGKSHQEISQLIEVSIPTIRRILAKDQDNSA